MNGLNKAYLIGHLGRDPELRATPSGVTVVKLSLATRHAKKVDDQWVETPDWHRVTAFGRDAEYLCRAAHKGDVVALECAIRPRKWTDKEEKVHYEVDLVVERVLWVSRKVATPANRVDEPPRETPVVVVDEEVPF
ncbi:MAG: single-stranded DNA-binding protein [Myxococcota bacterium]